MPVHSLVATRWSYAIVLYVALFVWGASELIAAFLRRAEKGATLHDRGSRTLIFIMIPIGFVLGFFVLRGIPNATIAWHQPVLFAIGIALMAGGAMFRYYAIRTLGRYFTVNVATREGQEVVERGPYRWIRHPTYSGTLMTALGAGLAMTNWISLLLVFAFTLVAFLYRVHVEEQALCEGLGQPYRDYMRRTRRFIPFVW